MNAVRRLAFVSLLALAVATPACRKPAEAPLADAAIGGSFRLTDQDGRTVTDRSFAGRYRIVYFGYTFCPDVCPTTLATVSAGLRGFAAQAPERAGRIQPIFVTVDPARDTPAVLKAYVAAFPPRLIGLTGPEAEIARVAKEYAVSYAKAPGAKGSDYLMDHMSVPILFGPDGKPIAILPTDAGPQAVTTLLAQWVR